MTDRPRSLPSALVATLLLSVPLVALPVVGPVLAAWIGGRRASGNAWFAGLAAALLWGIGLWWVSGQTVKVGGTSVMLGPLSLLIPVICAGFVAGGLFAYGGRPGVRTGLVILTAGLLWSGYQLQPVLTLVKEFRPASAAPSAGDTTCPEHLKQLYNAAMLYSDSWDGMLPPADRWQDALNETLPDARNTHCPALGEAANGYAMNDKLGGARVSDVADAPAQPLFYDSSLPGPNAHDAFASCPNPGRHAGRSNVVYSDGRVEVVRGE
jgi:prepilin-type processing-associated H-X9-DG protein